MESRSEAVASPIGMYGKLVIVNKVDDVIEEPRQNQLRIGIADTDAEPRSLWGGATRRRTVGRVQNVGIRVGRTWPGGLIIRGRPCRGAAAGEYYEGRCEAKRFHDGVNSSNVALMTIWLMTNPARYVDGSSNVTRFLRGDDEAGKSGFSQCWSSNPGEPK